MKQDSALDTFPKHLLHTARVYADRPAMRHKNYGVWQSWTWAKLLEEIRAYSIGLEQLGVAPGDKVALVGSNRPRLYWTFAAVQALGAVPVPVYAESVAEEMEYVLSHADVKYAVCQDQEQVDKLLSMSEAIKAIRHIIYDEERGLRDYDHTQLHHFENVQQLGWDKLKNDSEAERRWLDAIERGQGDELCVMLYTSGTTGTPKGVMLSHNNVLSASKNANLFDNLNEKEEVLAYLPLAWVGDHIFSYGQFVTAGYCVCCPESHETVEVDRREIAPTYFFAPPRVFETLLTTITVRMQDAGRFKRWLYDYFMTVARRCGEDRLNGKPTSLKDGLLYSIGNLMVYGPLRNRMGMSRLKVGYTAGEAIGPEIFSYYRALGINLKQLYGQTEASVYITAQPDGEIFADTVGKPSPEVELEVDASGEVLYRSPGVFMGYYKNDDATRETKNAEGWVKTGDAGFIDAKGHLKIIDRAKDVGKLTDGSMFPPKYIENKLKFFPNIQEAVAFGNNRDYTAVFLNIDLVAVGNWAERNNIAYASYQELAAHPEVYRMMEEHVDQVNRDLSSEEQMAGAQIRRFLILHKELDADDGELTRTLKVRRSFIADRYGALIEALYSDKKEQFITTEVVFEDGRRGELSATVLIRDMTTHGRELLQETA